jgi:hypothetical protein
MTGIAIQGSAASPRRTEAAAAAVALLPLLARESIIPLAVFAVSARHMTDSRDTVYRDC